MILRCMRNRIKKRGLTNRELSFPPPLNKWVDWNTLELNSSIEVYYLRILVFYTWNATSFHHSAWLSKSLWVWKVQLWQFLLFSLELLPRTEPPQTNWNSKFLLYFFALVFFYRISILNATLTLNQFSAVWLSHEAGVLNSRWLCGHR